MNEEELLEHLKTNGIESYWQQEMLVNYADKLQKELEEKTTIIMAGAEKVKALEKENEEKDKVINLMAEEIDNVVNKFGHFMDYDINKLETKDEIIQYFYKEVGGKTNE